MDSPIIDLSLLSSASSHQLQKELCKLQTTLSSWGCFQLINHGLSSLLLNQIREVGKEFFDLPLEVKQKHCITLDCFEGYGGDTVSENQSYNWNDRLQLKVHPLEQQNFKLWPDYVPNFRETLEEYTMKVRGVLKMILKAIARSLNLDENIFLEECGGKEGINMFTRFNYYPPCSSPYHVLGLKPHSDSTTITILLQDKKVEGLQVLKDNQWFKVPIVSDALFINIDSNIKKKREKSTMDVAGRNVGQLMQRWIYEEFAYITQKGNGGISDLEEEQRIRRELQLPSFDGRNYEEWILILEDSFQYFQLNEETKFQAAVMALEGDAQRWFEWEHRRWSFNGWQEMEKHLSRSFNPSSMTTQRGWDGMVKHQNISMSYSHGGMSNVTGCCTKDNGKLVVPKKQARKSGRAREEILKTISFIYPSDD
ncbi:hypothetical protein BVRB_8g193200 [Beta vulgaris subsp. vulgaris]|nr:hypothetical protein BVRB_8g193200 [Beta vulgaris subsp. vulgaris]